MEEVFSSLFFGDYLMGLGIPFSNVEHLQVLLSDHGGHGASSSGGANNEN